MASSNLGGKIAVYLRTPYIVQWTINYMSPIICTDCAVLCLSPHRVQVHTTRYECSPTGGIDNVRLRRGIAPRRAPLESSLAWHKYVY